MEHTGLIKTEVPRRPEELSSTVLAERTSRFAQEFTRPDLLYLNSGTHSQTPLSTLEAQIEWIRTYERNPTLNLMNTWEKIGRVQKRAAKFLGADSDSLFLRPNVTEALNDAIFGFDLVDGDLESQKGEILAPSLEYGAVLNICRYRAERDGRPFRTFDLHQSHQMISEDPSLARDELTHQVVSALSERTRMLVLSHVITGTGWLMPIAEIARETRKRGIRLIVDGAHATGAIELRLDDLTDVDAYCGNFHKWVMGPKGTAFGWVPARNHDSFRPPSAGWTTFAGSHEYDKFSTSRFAQRLLSSACRDFSSWMALEATFDFWDRHGHSHIRETLAAQDRLALASAQEAFSPLLSRGKMQLIPVPSSIAGGPAGFGFTHGPLIAYRLSRELGQLGLKLHFPRYFAEKLGVQVNVVPIGSLGLAPGASATERAANFALRLSPHIYTTQVDLITGLRRLGEGLCHLLQDSP